MTPRTRMARVFAGKQVVPPPVSVRLDLWYNEAVASDALPAEIDGLSAAEIEDYLGFARAARHRSRPHLVFASGPATCSQTAGHLTETYRIGSERLVRQSCRTDDMVRQGLAAHVQQYPLRDQDDYHLFLAALQDARIELDVDGFAALDAATGDHGLPVLIINSCPAHAIMLHWAGYEGFFYHLADFPELVADVIEALEALYRRDVWPKVAQSSAQVVIHGNHFSTQMTPPSLFSQWFLPYFQAFNDLMHDHGKQVLWHADAEMGGLLELVLEADFDGADCLATVPLVPQTLTDYHHVWGERIVCWGGLPGTIFSSEYPADRYRRYVESVLDEVIGKSKFILGASDNVMPGAEWWRLAWLAEQTAGC